MEWYYAKHGKQEGPVDLTAIRSKLQSGEIAPTDLVWKDGMAEWMAAGGISELTAARQTPLGPEVQAPVMRNPVTGGGTGISAGPAGGYVQTPPAHPVHQHYPGMAVPGAAPTNGLAIASLVCGILSLVMCYVNGLAALPAIVCGHAALKQIGNSPTPMGGRGLATAGLITGYIGLSLQLLVITFVIIGISMKGI